ncbi:serine/threonine protein kinase [Halobacteroides halobius DSM 5150]|uniref:non-specific serine/threonine protein kinase n=1 Tax=Halobacteroides halobius (strain ATCC 35273 / DSM 5150 / MD-1) TaxID=748449 RepID=L0K8J4_HALHC|nr:Stk1 family PASTA domain-containing Ser/Thr kinase [Halobacteroides halobius]AGB40855.1 serine/threonine protein kinase [Halobacteroides halobius DSM 5150]
MIGRVLNGRYKLLERIGAGGMAIVYLGKDKLLDRKVAIKVLQPQFADNKKAVRRFNHEAKAVASLSHPNIVNIFDIGQEDNLHYIVMEYITGYDLKEVLKKQGRLELDRAVKITKGVCRALIKAHRNNIVHCDIKPHNILLTEDDTVKVTDFGIAQAVTDATMAQTSSILGSAHYLSPEQAEGKKVSTKSDIYSLGIVLYELVTGEVPFGGESSVSIALKHVEEEPPSPKKRNADIPDKLKEIILRAMAKETKDRYNSAAEMLRDLKEVSNDLDTAQRVSNQETMVISRDKINSKEENQDLEDDSKVASKEENNEKGRGLFFTLGIIGLILTIVLGTGYYFLMDYLTVPKVTVPNIIKKDLQEAKEELEKKGLRFDIYYKTYSNRVAQDHIISQSPQSGSVVRKNRIIEVVVSKGAKLVKVPNLTNKTLRYAKVSLSKSALKLGTITKKYSNQVPEEQVISQTPKAKTKVESNTKVQLVVSKGRKPKKVIVPSVVGLRKEEGISKLRERNLILGQIINKKSLNYLKGEIIAQQPSAGSKLMEGSTVKLIVSSGIRNPYNAQVKTSVVRTYIPPGQKREVKIVVKDDNGRRIVYQKVHQPKDRIEKQIITVGSAIIRVYIDGRLNIEKRL